ncbi:hypothetical protein JHK87_055557 [Glycine soja]|nr:hypothetical protein JHK87_055557 [Glycine soja]
MEEKSAIVDDSSAQFLDARHFFISFSFQTSDISDKQHGFDVLRGAAGDKNSGILLSDKQWFVKHVVHEETLENEQNIKAFVSDPRLQKSKVKMNFQT